LGLFSSKTQTYVGTSVSRLIDDSLLPNSVRTGTNNAIFSDGEIVDHVMEELIASIGVRCERMYKYAKNKYTHGMPSGSFTDSTRGRPQVQAVLDSLEGQDVSIEYCHYGPGNLLHQGWMRLVSQYAYNVQTNEIDALSAAKGKPVFLDSLTVVVPRAVADALDPIVLAQWGESSTSGATPARAAISGVRLQPPVVVSNEVSQETIRVRYVWNTGRSTWTEEGPIPEVVWETVDLVLPAGDPEEDFFHVRYQVGSQTKFWMYRVRSGSYPTLDTFHDGLFTSGGSYFPRVYFRLNKQDQTANKNTQAYKTSKKMLKYLGINYDGVAEAIHENPDIGSVEQAILTLAVPADTENALERRYLFDYFERMYFLGDNQFQRPQDLDIFRGLGNEVGRVAVVIQDQQSKMVLSHNGIFRRRVAGVLGPVGTYSSSVGDTVLANSAFDDESGTYVDLSKTVKERFYRRQVSRGFYDEIRVVDLEMRYFVLGQYYTTTSDDDSKLLLVPLDRSITKGYSLTQREELYSRSLHFVFNSVQYVKVRWYQQFWFQGVLFFLAVVVTVLSFGSTTGALAAALQTGTAAAINAALTALLIKIAWGFVIAIGLKLFVKLVGAEAAFIIAVVAALAGMGMVIQAGSVAGAPWAQELLSLANGLGKAVSAEIQASYQALLGEFSDFQKLMTEQTELLEQSKKLLESNNFLSPFVIFGESPDDFYNRTVHSGNIGALSISAISSYVDIALRLPKLNDTLGEELA
jgi:hypothetical protein